MRPATFTPRMAHELTDSGNAAGPPVTMFRHDGRRPLPRRHGGATAASLGHPRHRLFRRVDGRCPLVRPWAQRLAAGDWIGSDVFYQAPLYPYFLGGLYAALGRDLLMVRLIQAMVGSAAVVLLASAGERLFSRRVGVLAGLALALYAPAIFFDALLQKSVLDVFFICLSIWVVSRLVDRPVSRRLWVGLGAVDGRPQPDARERPGAGRRGGRLEPGARIQDRQEQTADGRRQTAGRGDWQRTKRWQKREPGTIVRIANPGFRIAGAPDAGLRPRSGGRPVAGRRSQLRGHRRPLPHHLAVRPELLYREQPGGGRHLHVASARTGRTGVRTAGRDGTG